MWDKIFLDNTVGAYVVAIGSFLLLLLLKRGISLFFARFLYRFVSGRWKAVDRAQFLHYVVHPIENFIVAFGAGVILNTLNFPAKLNFSVRGITAEDLFHKVVTLFIIISFFRLVYLLVEFVALILTNRAKNTEDLTDDQMVSFVRDLIKVLVVIVGGMVVISQVLDKDISSLLTGLSIVGAAVALAAKESLENLIASFVIFSNKPFMVGDFVKVNNFSGTVEKIGLRSTRIRTVEKTLITVPNKQMVDSVVDNVSRQSQRRGTLNLELAETTPAAKAADVVEAVKNILKKHDSSILSSTVFLSTFAKGGSTINAEYFTPMMPLSDFNLLKEKINLAAMDFLQAEDVALATGSSTINLVQEPAPPVKKDLI